MESPKQFQATQINKRKLISLFSFRSSVLLRFESFRSGSSITQAPKCYFPREVCQTRDANEYREMFWFGSRWYGLARLYPGGTHWTPLSFWCGGRNIVEVAQALDLDFDELPDGGNRQTLLRMKTGWLGGGVIMDQRALFGNQHGIRVLPRYGKHTN